MAEDTMINDTMSIEDILFDTPIPGQSLTQSPDSPMPYERPPQFTNFEEAQDYMLQIMMDSGGDIVDALSMGIPVEFVGPQFPIMGAASGKWNPDVMLLLIEPSIYITLFIAEQAGVEDYVLEFDEEIENLSPETRLKIEDSLSSTIKSVSRQIGEDRQAADIQSIMPASLLSKVEENTDGV